MKKKAPRIIAVGGGKGGVGKTTVSANLALAIGRAGKRVAVVDADLGAANLHTALGVKHPQKGIGDFIDGGASDLDSIATQVMPTVKLVAGTSRPGSADLGAAQKLRLLRALGKLDAEVVLVDVGAGTSYTVVDLFAAADHKLLVVTPQLTSVHNAYALLKACVHRVIRKLATSEMHQDLIDAALAQETKTRTIPQLLGAIRPMDPDLGDAIVDVLVRFGVLLVANQLQTTADGAALARMSPLIHDQLLLSAPMGAGIRRTASLAGSLQAGVGTIATKATDEATQAFRHLADTLLSTDLAQLRGETRSKQGKTMPLWIQRGLEMDAAREG